MTFRKIKSYMMPIAMMIGCFFYKYLSGVSFFTPYLIAAMLFVSYSNISWTDIKITRLHLILLAIQIVGGVAVLVLLTPFDPIIAQGSMICILAPTATSAVVITGMLGGNMASLTSYTIVSNLAVAIIAPIIFSLVDVGGSDISFIDSLLSISERVFILLLLPLFLATLTARFCPLLHSKIRENQRISFYMWILALTIATAKTISFIADQDTDSYLTEVILAAVALTVCIAQFAIGKRVGTIYGDRVAGGQGLGQKNTILSIWMAQSYLNPISSIAPGAYILWQNIINSYQVWKKMNNKKDKIEL